MYVYVEEHELAAGGHWMHGTGRDTTTSGPLKPLVTPARYVLLSLTQPYSEFRSPSNPSSHVGFPCTYELRDI